MYAIKSTLGLLIVLFAYQTFAMSPELLKEYADFRLSYSKIFDLAKDKSKFSEKFLLEKNELEKKFEQFVSKEKEEQGDQLSVQGNQMALDLEMLSPLEELAKSRMDAEACEQALHSNNLNSKSSKDSFRKVQVAIETLCSKVK